MTRVGLGWDEWYPVYEIDHEYPDMTVDLPDDLIERAVRATQEFIEVQGLLRDARYARSKAL